MITDSTCITNQLVQSNTQIRTYDLGSHIEKPIDMQILRVVVNNSTQNENKHAFKAQNY